MPSNFRHVQTKLDASEWALLKRFMDANEMNVGQALRACVVRSLGSAQQIKMLGYKDGKRQGLHEAKEVLEGATKEMF